MSSVVPQPALDLEAARRGDVLEVDAAEDRARSRSTVRTISSTSFVARQIGNASTPPNSLNRTALPSMTGSARLGADVAEPEHGRAVADDGDGVLLDRQRPDLVGIRRRSPTRRGRRPACTPSRGRRASSAASSSAPRACRRGAAGRCGRRRARPRSRADCPDRIDDPLEVARVRGEDGDVADLVPAPRPGRGRSRRAARLRRRSPRRARRTRRDGSPDARAASR